jgi:hypothetical protein
MAGTSLVREDLGAEDEKDFWAPAVTVVPRRRGAVASVRLHRQGPPEVHLRQDRHPQPPRDLVAHVLAGQRERQPVPDLASASSWYRSRWPARMRSSAGRRNASGCWRSRNELAGAHEAGGSAEYPCAVRATGWASARYGLDHPGRDLAGGRLDGWPVLADKFAHRHRRPGDSDVDRRDDVARTRAHRRGDGPQRALKFLIVDGQPRAAHPFELGEQGRPACQGAWSALDEVDSVKPLVKVGSGHPSNGPPGQGVGDAAGGVPSRLGDVAVAGRSPQGQPQVPATNSDHQNADHAADQEIGQAGLDPGAGIAASQAADA